VDASSQDIVVSEVKKCSNAYAGYGKVIDFSVCQFDRLCCGDCCNDWPGSVSVNSTKHLDCGSPYGGLCSVDQSLSDVGQVV
jgi:hypothetical protein